MRFIADFHVHSHYSRATSKEMNLVSLAKWGQLKGIELIGTGDFTHPLWFDEIQQKLEPAEPGLFRLKSALEKEISSQVPMSCRNVMRFILSVEVSCIYKKNDRVRKMHVIILAPSFAAAARINAQLQRIGNIASDGRPILGLDAKRLLEIVLDADPNCLFIPAHAWTPHFSVFGSQSGFDSLEEAFDELAPQIVAIETGLSSDPAMNWRLPQLDNIALISNSDAHSPQKLGREANIFQTNLDYFSIVEALRTNNRNSFEATIEFFPEEGKYHLDGHRPCNFSCEPAESRKRNLLCAACGKKLTIGVLHRVESLAKRPAGFHLERARPYYNIIPLPEIISEIEETGVASKRVQETYHALLRQLGNEFSILLSVPVNEIAKVAGVKLAEAISLMRSGKVSVRGGYDGEYGIVKVFEREQEADVVESKQRTLF